MKLAIMSDLHIEDKNSYSKMFNMSFAVQDTGLTPLELKHEYVAIVAGDISSKSTQVVECLRYLAQHYYQVVYVFGNHEFYITDMRTMKQRIKLAVADLDNVHVLDNEFVEIDDCLFFGATLWTDFKKAAPLDLYSIPKMMNDFNCIFLSSDQTMPLITIEDMQAFHAKSLSRLTKLLEKAPDRKVIVVTHHSPSEKGTDKRFAGHPLNAAFSSHLDDFIIQHPNIKVWVHGHKHNEIMERIGNTTMICHPMGYSEEIKRVTSYKPLFYVVP